MASRPYFNKSIKELELLYQTSGNDPKVSKALLHELGFRTKTRARAQKLEDAINSRQQSLPLNGGKEPDASPESSAAKAEPPSAQPTLEPTQNESLRHPKPSDVEFSTRPVISKPPVTDKPEDILRAWTALEVLSPSGYRRKTDLAGGDAKRIASIESGPLPWEIGEKSRPKKRLYYELILGTINLGPAIESLLKIYSDNRPDTPRTSSRASLASILADKEGRPLEEDTSFAISSFAWGVPIALSGDLRLLANWPSAERDIGKRFRQLLIQRNSDGDVIPLNRSKIKALFDHLVTELNLTGLDIAPPDFAIRRYEFFASKVPPEPTLLNSFYLQDLALARDLTAQSKAPTTLKHYLGMQKPDKRTDLLSDHHGLRELLQPAKTPLGRWPGPGRFSLALLQQAAVNATFDGLTDTGILSVNGPPGTGKTTLLRDIVAARVVERAASMAQFKNPADAFKPTKEVLQRGGAKVVLHRIDERLKGFEMIVASSNNKAVENVSAELPALDAIAEDATELRYFSSISDNMLERETWGVIAAVLGNASNRYQVAQNFWRDEERGLSTYLNHATGAPQFAMEPQEEGPPIKRLRAVVKNENPPENPQEAQKRWTHAKADFLAAMKRAEVTQSSLQKIHLELAELSALTQKLERLDLLILELNQQLSDSESRVETAREQSLKFVTQFDRASDRLAWHNKDKPGIFARIFRLQVARDWRETYRNLSNEIDSARSREREARAEFERLEANFDSTARQMRETAAQQDRLREKLSMLEQSINAHKAKRSAPVPDDAFFSGGHDTVQKAHIWFDSADTVERDEVFEAAMNVHRAFIDCAADPIRQNLAIFTEAFGIRSLGTAAKDDLIPDLWSTFFLTVPVVSTTFASVHRMFSRLPPNTFGWLLVDEAGQAVPQAAVGAIMRAKQAVVVGDPLQVEPVVTLPNTLTEEICGYFGITAQRYNAPEASVQTLADSASPYCARFPLGSGHRDVGSPLLVHRRCDSPMFEISNSLAYANLMVQAKKPSGYPLPLGAHSGACGQPFQ